VYDATAATGADTATATDAVVLVVVLERPTAAALLLALFAPLYAALAPDLLLLVAVIVAAFFCTAKLCSCAIALMASTNAAASIPVVAVFSIAAFCAILSTSSSGSSGNSLASLTNSTTASADSLGLYSDCCCWCWRMRDAVCTAFTAPLNDSPLLPTVAPTAALGTGADSTCVV
jgi:hypothetical protein